MLIFEKSPIRLIFFLFFNLKFFEKIKMEKSRNDKTEKKLLELCTIKIKQPDFKENKGSKKEWKIVKNAISHIYDTIFIIKALNKSINSKEVIEYCETDNPVWHEREKKREIIFKNINILRKVKHIEKYGLNPLQIEKTFCLSLL